MEKGAQVIQKVWNENNWRSANLQNLQQRLKQCSIELGTWNAKHRKDAHKEIEEKNKRLKEILQREGPVDGVHI